MSFYLHLISAVSYGVFFLDVSARPKKFLVSIHTLFFLFVFRTFTLYLLPLTAPETIIPFYDQVAYGNTIVTNDLFFSGHTAVMYSFFLLASNRIIKRILLVLFIVTAISVLLQHIHYTIDVVAAPFFAYGSYRLSQVLNQKYFKIIT